MQCNILSFCRRKCMNYNEAIDNNKVDFGNMPPQPFLLGLLSAFDNRYQAIADSYFGEITWKQFFAIICINLCKEPPTINELADVIGSSHQNVKQILLKLERKGFVQMLADENDKRKQRIRLTKECMNFCEKNDEESKTIIYKIFEGIDENDLLNSIKTLLRMEENLKNI